MMRYSMRLGPSVAIAVADLATWRHSNWGWTAPVCLHLRGSRLSDCIASSDSFMARDDGGDGGHEWAGDERT